MSKRRGNDYVDLALLTDGLRAEREQGITIDVAYRYFSTPAPRLRHRRLPGTRPVHAQHDHRRVARRLGDRPRRRSTRHRRADPPAHPARVACCASRTSSSPSTRWISSATTSSASTRSATDFLDHADGARHRSPTPWRSSRSPHSPERTSSSASRPMPWYSGPTLLDHLETVEVTDGTRSAGAVPGAVRHPAAARRAPRLPRLRRHGRRRDPADRRRGRRAPVGDHHNGCLDRHGRWSGR